MQHPESAFSQLADIPNVSPGCYADIILYLRIGLNIVSRARLIRVGITTVITVARFS